MIENESNKTRSSTLVPILATIGAGLVISAVISLLGIKWPWLMLIAGIVLIAITVFISIPGAANYLSPFRIFKRVIIAWIWRFKRPNWSCTKPIIYLDKANQTQADDNARQIRYTAGLSIVIKNRDDFSLQVVFYSLQINIEQGSGRSTVKCILRPDVSESPDIRPNIEESFKFNMHGTCGRDSQLDLTKPFNWGVQGITVYLNGVGFKDLRRGIYYKPVPQQRVSLI
jgi:hypothetical protein